MHVVTQLNCSVTSLARRLLSPDRNGQIRAFAARADQADRLVQRDACAVGASSDDDHVAVGRAVNADLQSGVARCRAGERSGDGKSLLAVVGKEGGSRKADDG